MALKQHLNPKKDAYNNFDMPTAILPKKNYYIFLFIFSALWLLAISLNAKKVTARRPVEWASPQQIPGYANFTKPPYLIADQNYTVHAFTSQWVGKGSQYAVVYNQWSLEKGWTDPNDILLSPIEQARVKGAVLDDTGIMHVLFFGGDDMAANIYYSQALAVDAANATAWLSPVKIGFRAITPDEASLAGDGKSRLVVVYSGNMEGIGLYTVQSEDKGLTWTEPVPLTFTYSDTLLPSALKTYSDKAGNIHAVWTISNLTTGNGVAIYYAKLPAGKTEWTDPIALAEVTAFEVDTASIIEYNDALFVIYHNDSPTTRWMRRSFDGGKTWNSPVRLFPHVGSNGPASLVIDSSNTLHMFFGNRVGDHPADYGMWHSVWNGDRWLSPEAIVVKKRVIDDVGGNGFDPSFAHAVVSQGNTLLVTWITDPAAGPNGVWYSYATLPEAPELPAIPLPVPPTATPIPTQTPTPLPSPTPSPTPRQILSNAEIASAEKPISNPISPLTTSGAITAIFIIIVIAGWKILH